MMMMDYNNSFASDCQLVAMDGTTVLIDGGANVAEFYRLLVYIRQGTLQTWKLGTVLPPIDEILVCGQYRYYRHEQQQQQQQ